MDDLDRELKLVQLQRERLALEREMAFQGIGGTAKKFAKAIGWGLAFPFRIFWGFCTRWWKVISSIVLLVGCIGVAVAWVKHSQEEAQKLAEEKWWAKATAYGEEACPAYRFACSSSYDCLMQESEKKICEYRAWSRYEQQVPRPKSN